MDTKKLNKWAEMLLDTGKRNNLIHFRNTKASTAEILLPDPETLFRKIEENTTFEVFDPKIAEEEPEEELLVSEEAAAADAAPADGKAAWLAQYGGRIRKPNQLLLYNPACTPLTAIRNIDKKASSFLEETGINVAYLAFGFIHWKENDNTQFVYQAPVLLVPIQLEQESAIDPYRLQPAADDLVVNPTFAYKLDAEYGVKLPDYNDEGLQAYLDQISALVSKLGWTVSSACKVGIFSFLKINMYRDLKDNETAILANPNVRRLLGEPVTEAHSDGSATRNTTPTPDPLMALHSVVDADSSQMEAIQMAKSGKSFVLQGPPGTGKSQTITNIIAECLSDGKKVLFVSEKLAALNVVYDKLSQAGLAEFCLQLHSHKANKKEVIAEICHTLRLEKSAVSARAGRELAIKARTKEQLDAYAAALHQQHPVIDASLYQLYEAYAALRNVPDVEWAVPAISQRSDEYLTETAALLEQYMDYLPSVGRDYRQNAWYGYTNPDTSYEESCAVKQSLRQLLTALDDLLPLLREISGAYGVSCRSMQQAQLWRDFFRFAADSSLLTPALLQPDTLATAQTTVADLTSLREEILSHQRALDAACDGDIYQLDGDRYHRLLTKAYSGFFSRICSSEYHQLIRELRLCRKDGRKPSYDEAVQLTFHLAGYQESTRAFRQAEAPLLPLLSPVYTGVTTDWNALTAQLQTLQALLSAGLSCGRLAELSDLTDHKPTFARYADLLDAGLADCAAALPHLAACFDPAVLDVYQIEASALGIRCQKCFDQLDKLDHWCHFRTLLAALAQQGVLPYLHTCIGQNLETQYIADAYRKLFCCQWIHTILAESPVLSSFDRIAQEQAIRTFVEKDTEQFAINQAVIRAQLSANRPSLDMIASGSAVATLLREGEKKRKQKSIRTLLAETGELVQEIKPCFLMSPLSVSTFLAGDAVHFDVVVFDEASQIFPQDAIGAIYRAQQLIVVGDSKQMPPSNFFNTALETETADEEAGDVADFESILDLCSTSMQQLRLRWHYRSRFEQLIAFSNQNFYDGELITFPSAQADAPGRGVDYYHVDGLFNRKTHTNRQEAEYIVDLIYRNLEQYPERSLGVVAFSVAQQELIDRLLARRRQTRPEKEIYFNKSQKEPFFIKNLETVQGDERDTIIFSVAYGKDSDGRLLHNFGPLNRVGGERRLNVAVTRAKCNVQMVSSMHATDIDLTRTSAEGARLLREYLDFAEHGAVALERTLSVRAFEQFDSAFEMDVCEFLRQQGFAVDTQVGCSGFRIDLGLKRPDSSDYVLAIECDGATYHSARNARDRDRLRQQILERMGWQFYRIWSTDWFRNRTVEQKRLLEAVRAALQQTETAAAPAPQSQPETPTFEVAVAEAESPFPVYVQADPLVLHQHHKQESFPQLVKRILDVEAPLSEELLLKRVPWYFGRTKVTSVVKAAYEESMSGCERFGILRKGGFLYLADGPDIPFRRPGDVKREIRQIAPEELAAGMLEILRQNVSADKKGLYQLLAQQCGVSRLTDNAVPFFDEALGCLQDQIYVDSCDGRITLDLIAEKS